MIVRQSDNQAQLPVQARLALVLAALAAIALLLAATTGAASRTSVTSRDRAATRAYLQAGLVYERSLLASTQAASASVEALARNLENECPGVMDGAPEPEAENDRGEAPQPSARKQGELNREQRQRSELESELDDTISLTLLDADRNSALVFAHTMAALHWANADVNTYMHTRAAVLEWNLGRAQPNVCADMKTWSTSGYRMLSSATKALFSERAAVEHSERELLQTARGPVPSFLLHSFERTYKKLVHRLANLEQTHRTSLKGLQAMYERLSTALGLGSESEEPLGPPKGATVIESGKTAAGTSFTIWVNPTPESAQTAHLHCPLSIGLAEKEERKNGSGSGSSTDMCLSRQHPEDLQLECDRNHWQIQGQTVEGAQSVTLTLSNGRQISSPVAIVPAANGGPAGFYYEVLRKPAQTPVLLTELDASGTPLRTIKLSPKTACPKNLPKPPKPPEFLPGGGTIVVGHVPHGPHFMIISERTRFMGHIESRFSVIVAQEEPDGQFGDENSKINISSAHRRPNVIQIHTETGCQPAEYAIVYGLLTAPNDTVLARTATGLKPMHRVVIPKILHLHGVLAYIALSGFPTEILVRTPAGKTVFTEKLTRRAHEARETCEGEAEG